MVLQQRGLKSNLVRPIFFQGTEMFNLFKYIKSFFKSFFHEQTLTALSKQRSGRWGTIRKRHIESNPTCAACGGIKKVSVHHCVPLHLDESKELDPNNLISLCEENNCHHAVGHLFSWFSYNPNVREDAAIWLEKVQNRPKR